MSDLEQRVQESLARHAGLAAPRPMPAGTTAGVRAREAAFVGTVALVTALAVVAGLSLLWVLPRGSDRGPAADAFTSPLEQVPPGWPPVDIQDPSTTETPSLEIPRVNEGPVLLVAGTVDGSAFSLSAWTQGAGGRLCIGLAGPSAPEAAAGAATPRIGCVRGGMPEADLAVFASSGDRPDLTATFGLVHERVFEVWAAVAPFGAFEIPLLHGTLGEGEIDAFVFFAPPGPGRLEAYGPGGMQHGTAVADAALCEAGFEGTCRPEVSQLTPTSSDLPAGVVPPAPGTWPEVVEGGDFTPYVDHVMNEQGVLDAGVVTPKTPIIWGTVQGIPFSLTAFDVDGRGDWRGSAGPDGEPGPAGELFLGAGAAYGGTGLGLYGTTPWQPSDLGLATASFESGALTALAGVTSERVETLELRLDEGEVRTIDLVPGPEGVHGRYFVLWAPNDLAGTVVALGAAGEVLAIQDICVPVADTAPGTTSVCG